MSVGDLEIELARLRGEDRPPSNAVRVSVEDALSFRNRGNLPDEQGRTLRLALRPDPTGAVSLDEKRLQYEPDFMDLPDWRKEGSRPINVVPLGRVVTRADSGAWWEDDDMAALELQWNETGEVDGIKIPGAYRSFIYKTIVLLRRTGTDVTVDAISNSIARWLDPEQVKEIRVALVEANPNPPND